MKVKSVLVLVSFLGLFLLLLFNPLIFPQNTTSENHLKTEGFSSTSAYKNYTSLTPNFTISLPTFPPVSIGDTIVLADAITGSGSVQINTASLPDSANWHRINGHIESGEGTEMLYYVAQSVGAFTVNGTFLTTAVTGSFYLFNLGQNIQVNHIINETNGGTIIGSGTVFVGSFTARSDGIIIGVLAYQGTSITAGANYTLFPPDPTLAGNSFGVTQSAYFPTFSTTTAPMSVSGGNKWSYTVVQFVVSATLCTSFAGVGTTTSSSVYSTTDTFTTILGGSTTVRTTTITTTFDATTQTTTQTTTSVSGGTTAFFTSAHLTTSFTTRTTTTVFRSVSTTTLNVTQTATAVVAPSTSNPQYWIFGFVALLLPVGLFTSLIFEQGHRSGNPVEPNAVMFAIIAGLLVGSVIGLLLNVIPWGITAIFVVIFFLYLWKGRG